MARRLLTPEREAELLARYPTEGNNALAQDFGLTAAQVAHIAYEKQVTKTAATRAHLNATRGGAGTSTMQQVLAAVEAAGEAGMSLSELAAALPGLNVGSAPSSLAARGHLHAVGPRGGTRYFTDIAHAQAHATACSAAPCPRSSTPLSPRARSLRQASASAPASPPAPSASRLFRDLGPGQYVDTAPCSWVAAVIRRP